ncbi:MAG: helix-turn-helix transcriptional regulator [Candidatus Diapherotrites archaeon]|uniref:Helix-turn-helix transcriptional regulator n=1 Tax=Candidatus Iainarchaeum sp. TaxID=3101447 RepID=A0A938YXK7_9ARCH|nr:helix-turn-helix transcriptional regulator [Candidatus Diapherotrites archaeon]
MADEERRASFKIVVRRVEKPFSHSLDKELEWICRCLGFFEPIDREKTAASVFKEIVKAAESRRPLTSTSLAEKVDMSRGSVINHLNNLQRSGLIVRHGRVYLPRSRSVFRTIEEIEEDIDRIFARMKKTAREIDQEFGIKVEE